MLQSFTDGIQTSKWLRWIIIGVITVPFALWGVSSYFSANADDYVALVNGEEISAQAYQREYAQQRQRLAQNFNGRLPEIFAGNYLKLQTLDSMIQQELLLQSVEAAGYRVSREELLRKLTDYEVFQTEGAFDKDRYTNYLQSVGSSTTEFEQMLQQATLLTQMRNAVVETAFVIPTNEQRLEQLNQQTRSFSVMRFKADQYESAVEISDDDIKTYYDAHQDRYMQPAAVKLEYLELDIAALSEQVDISESALQNAYEEQKQTFLEQEQRQTSHILLKLEADASEAEVAARRQELEALRERIQNGEAFAEVAKAHSEDPGSAQAGGDLGAVQRGIMVQPFEDALFAMQPGEISEPVRTGFGWHLIRLEQILAPQQKPFEEVREELAITYREREADRLFFERLEDLTNETYENGDTLSVAAEIAGLTIKETDWIERDQGEGVGAHANIREAAFSEKVHDDGLNSDVLEVGNNHVFVVRVKEKRPATQQSLDTVKDIVALELKLERAREAAKTAADAAMQKLLAGDDPQTVAAAFQSDLTQFNDSKRDANQPSRQIVQAAFHMPKPKADTATYERLEIGNDYAVVILHAVTQPEMAKPATDSAAAQTDAAEVASEATTQADESKPEIVELQRNLGSRDYDAWIENLEANADITRREDLL